MFLIKPEDASRGLCTSQSVCRNLGISDFSVQPYNVTADGEYIPTAEAMLYLQGYPEVCPLVMETPTNT